MATVAPTSVASPSRVSAVLLAFGAGSLFAVGLALAGMTDPAKVRGFLDVTGAWDPSLAFVMIGAIAVHAPLVRLIQRRRDPVFATSFTPLASVVDARLFAGAAIFGVGWGIAGYCPGPALTSLVGGSLPGLMFVAAMVAGMLLARLVGARGEGVRSDSCS